MQNSFGSLVAFFMYPSTQTFMSFWIDFLWYNLYLNFFNILAPWMYFFNINLSLNKLFSQVHGAKAELLYQLDKNKFDNLALKENPPTDGISAAFKAQMTIVKINYNFLYGVYTFPYNSYPDKI